MKVKEKVITCILCGIVICIYFIFSSYSKMNDANKIYNVYLDGENIGSIVDKEALYTLIDEKQQIIKDKYGVSNVYPPNGLEIVETYSYNEKITDINSIYNKIEEMQDFTILGYEIKIAASNEHEAYSIYVLDKGIFNTAVREFILAFIDEEDYNNYMNGTQEELEDIGINYNDMNITEDISIQEKYVSINEKIYTSSDELAQHLLFGFDYKERSYTVKVGDTIESISDDNSLNTQEFLIANPKYTSKDNLLTIGEKVNITLINPILAFEYTITEMKEVEIPYEKDIVVDKTKSSSYSEITTRGVTGLEIQTSYYTVTNGEPSSEVTMLNKPVVIRETVNQVTTRGERTWGWETVDDSTDSWKWPTQNHFAVTSEFSWRWGKQHNAIDISGTGTGSKIYAANDGVVVYAHKTCPNEGSYPNSCGGGFGNYVVIQHSGNIYTVYAHMLNDVPVSVGQTVKAKQVIGYMGNSGQSKGTHLHFGASRGDPYKGGTYFNPRELYK